MVIGNRAFWFALSCGLTLLVGGALADYLGAPASVVKASEVNSQAANTAPTFVSSNGTILQPLGAEAGVGDVVIHKSGYIYAAVNFGYWDRDPIILGYTPSGIIDPSFGAGGQLTVTAGPYSAVYALLEQSNGMMVFFVRSSSGDRLKRIDRAGKLDLSFGLNGEVLLPNAGSDFARLLEQPDEKILVTYRSDSDLTVARVDKDGQFDGSFGVGGVSKIDYPNGDVIGRAMAIKTNGFIMLGGYTPTSGINSDFIMAQLNSNGILDESFSSGGFIELDVGGSESSHDYLNDLIALQGDKIVAIGESKGNLALACFLSSGIVDTTFGSNGVYFSQKPSTGYSGAIDSHQNIIVSGTNYTGINHNSSGFWVFASWRFDINGNSDQSFGLGGASEPYLEEPHYYNGGSVAYRSKKQADGKIIVAGRVYQDPYLVRYNDDGSFDTGFGPTFNTLDGSPKLNEQSTGILDSNVFIKDQELMNFGTYDGATLTIARRGGTNPEDVFSSSGNLTVLTPGSYFAVDGVTIGQVLTNSGGNLQLRFLGANATQARVDKAMQQIAYTNTSDRPPAQVLIDWTFDDGNTGAQGTGGALSTTGTVTVNITPVNDPPRLDNPPPAQTAAVGTAFSYTLPANTFSDPDGDTLSYSVAMADNTGLPLWLTFNAATRTFSGTPSQSDLGSLNLKLTAKDPSNATAVAYLSITIEKPSVTAAVTAANKPYDGTATATISACTLTGVVSPDVVTCSASAASFADANAGNGKTVTATDISLGGTDAAKYTLSSPTATTTANITKATATVSLVNLTQAYTGGSLTPSVTTTPAGLTVTWTGAPQTNAGSYPVTASINEQNYQGSASGTFIINQASQAALILQAGSTAIFEGSSTTLSAQGGSNLGTVSYSAQATSGLTCAISGNQLTATGSAGTCTVTATRAGDGNYLPVSSSPLAITVTLPQRQLVVSKTGSGAVYSSPSGISCGSACSVYYDKYTPVTLTAEPASGQYFVGWSGACTGMGSCQLTMTDNRSVTATFAVIPQTGFTLTVTKTGNGTISSLSPNASINCGIACQGSFTAGQWVTLFAQPDKGHTFMGWSGPAAGLCGRQTSCDVYMSSNQSISGDFKNTYVLIMPAIQLLLE